MSECPDITDKQLATTNGCGSSAWYAWIFRIPKWVSKDFYCACAEHDIMYQSSPLRGMIFKHYVDRKLYNTMYRAAYNEANFIKRWVLLFCAKTTQAALNTKISLWCWYRAKRSA